MLVCVCLFVVVVFVCLGGRIAKLFVGQQIVRGSDFVFIETSRFAVGEGHHGRPYISEINTVCNIRGALRTLEIF